MKFAFLATLLVLFCTVTARSILDGEIKEELAKISSEVSELKDTLEILKDHSVNDETVAQKEDWSNFEELDDESDENDNVHKNEHFANKLSIDESDDSSEIFSEPEAMEKIFESATEEEHENKDDNQKKDGDDDKTEEPVALEQFDKRGMLPIPLDATSQEKPDAENDNVHKNEHFANKLSIDESDDSSEIFAEPEAMEKIFESATEEEHENEDVKQNKDDDMTEGPVALKHLDKRGMLPIPLETASEEKPDAKIYNDEENEELFEKALREIESKVKDVKEALTDQKSQGPPRALTDQKKENNDEGVHQYVDMDGKPYSSL